VWQRRADAARGDLQPEVGACHRPRGGPLQAPGAAARRGPRRARRDGPAGDRAPCRRPRDELGLRAVGRAPRAEAGLRGRPPVALAPGGASQAPPSAPQSLPQAPAVGGGRHAALAAGADPCLRGPPREPGGSLGPRPSGPGACRSCGCGGLGRAGGRGRGLQRARRPARDGGRGLHLGDRGGEEHRRPFRLRPRPRPRSVPGRLRRGGRREGRDERERPQAGLGGARAVRRRACS